MVQAKPVAVYSIMKNAGQIYFTVYPFLYEKIESGSVRVAEKDILAGIASEDDVITLCSSFRPSTSGMQGVSCLKNNK